MITLPLAEIIDKMPTSLEMWVTMLLWSLPFTLGLLWRPLGWIMVIIAISLSILIIYYSYHEAFVEVGMREAIRIELGTLWIINSLLSPLLPTITAASVLAVKYKEELTSRWC